MARDIRFGFVVTPDWLVHRGRFLPRRGYVT